MNTIATEIIENPKGNAIFKLFKSSRFLQICAALLFAQLALAALMQFNQKQATFDGGAPLFALTESEFNTVEISDGDETVVLQRHENGWNLGSNDVLPVDPTRITTLLNSLVDLKPGLPVASSVASREQLEVDDNEYQRKLIVNNDEANTYLFGTSPGLRKAHLRKQGSNEIYSVSLPVSDLPASIDQWLDKSVLALSNIERIELEAIAFERSGQGEAEKWSVSNAEDAGKILDTTKLTAAVTALQGLRVTGIHQPSSEPGDAAKTDAQVSESDDSSKPQSVKFTVTSEGKERKFVLNKADDRTSITRDDIDQSFLISESLFNQLAELGTASHWLIDSSEQDIAGD